MFATAFIEKKERPQIQFEDLRDFNYKYRLKREYVIDLPYELNLLDVKVTIDTGWLRLTEDGELTIRVGYCWDGCSGPTVDDDSNMRAGLVHDALYQLIRLGHLTLLARGQADKLLRTILKEDGMSQWRVWYYYNGLRLGGGPAVKPRKSEYPPVRVAPK